MSGPEMSGPDVSEVAPRRRGRRPAGHDTRGAILTAARAEFAARGYDGATMRGIARAAGVDPRLVHHYFDSREVLFVEALELPDVPARLIARVIDGPRADLGARLVRQFFGMWIRVTVVRPSPGCSVWRPRAPTARRCSGSS